MPEESPRMEVSPSEVQKRMKDHVAKMEVVEDQKRRSGYEDIPTILVSSSSEERVLKRIQSDEVSNDLPRNVLKNHKQSEEEGEKIAAPENPSPRTAEVCTLVLVFSLKSICLISYSSWLL